MNAMSRTSLALAGLGVVAAGSVGVHAVSVAWHAFGYISQDDAAIRPAPLKHVAVDVEPVVLRALFGATAVETALTSRNLALRGVIRASSDSLSTALISDAGGPVLAYRLGDRLPNGATLEGVSENSLTMRINGRLERLAFPNQPGAAAAESPSGSDASGVAAIRASIPGFGSTASAAQEPPALNVVPPADQAEPDSGARTREDVIDSYRQKVNDSPRSLADDLGVQATPTGYVVGADLSEPLRRAGLQPGDVVLSVNGNPVGDLERDRARFEEVAGGDTVRVTLKRGQQVLSLTFPLH